MAFTAAEKKKMLELSFLQNSRLKNAAPAHLRFSRVF